MESGSVYKQLQHLHELILAERDAARRLDLDALAQVVAQKEACLQDLSAAQDLDESCQELAEQVRQENRRNAYLLWTGLNLVRDTVSFFQKQAAPPAYGATGVMTSAGHGASLLSGRV